LGDRGGPATAPVDAFCRDADGNIVNYVGVQCEVNQVPIEEIKERAKRMALLDL